MLSNKNLILVGYSVQDKYSKNLANGYYIFNKNLAQEESDVTEHSTLPRRHNVHTYIQLFTNKNQAPAEMPTIRICDCIVCTILMTRKRTQRCNKFQYATPQSPPNLWKCTF